MNDQIPDQQVEEYRRAFLALDRDNNGRITTSDLKAVFLSLGHSIADNYLQDMINEVDVDGDGAIDVPEFLRMMLRKLRIPDQDDELRVIFQLMDRNQDGFVTPDELKQILAGLGEKLSDAEVAELIRECDADGDGRINFLEFTVMMTLPQLPL